MTPKLHKALTSKALALFAMLPGPVHAADRFREFDKNADGKVTREESGRAAWFDTLDNNGDGIITREEAAEAARNRPRPAPSGTEANDPAAYDPNRPHPVPLSESNAFTDLRFARDWIPGTQDRNGKLMTGTECNYLVSHGGRLHAAVGVWNIDTAHGENPGPGVLVKRSAASPWEVDVQFHPRNVRVPVLASLTFSTDVAGRRLDPPVNLLMSGSGSFEHPGQITVQVRDDAQGSWMPSFVAPSQGVRSFEVRHLFVHRDKVTGVDRVIAALTSGSVFSGGYDPAAPGRIRWNAEPELDGRLARIMSWGRANGDAYLAVDITPDAPKNGGLFHRVDGPQPRWEWIGEWGQRVQHRGVAWIRGLTAIADPANPGKELLLCSREVDGVIEVINPQRNHEVRVEFDLRKHFGGLIGAREGQRLGTIFAYNEMTPVTHPATGERVHLISGGVMPDLSGDDARSKGAWCLIRHADGRYATVRVFDPEVIPAGHGGLRCVRTICASPFAEEQGRVLYFGGYDAGDLGLGLRYRDSAWIYRARLP
jgi:hypothetical protein